MKKPLWKAIAAVLSASLFLLTAFPFDAAARDPKATPEGSEAANGRAIPCAVGEKLTFQVSWLGIPAGEATLELAGLEDGEDGKTYHFVSTARTNAFLSAFYMVRDRVDSYVDARNFSSKRYLLDQQEGSRVKKKEIIFDQEKGKATYILNDNPPQEYDLEPGSLDSLSSLYYVRTQEMKPGASLHVNVFDSRKNYNMEVKILKRERLDTPLGEVDTIMVKPIMRHEGIFKRKGEIYIWFTDDERKIPVKMKSKVTIGSISAELISVDGLDMKR